MFRLLLLFCLFISGVASSNELWLKISDASKASHDLNYSGIINTTDLNQDIQSTKIIHVNEIDAVGEGAMNLSGLSSNNPIIIVSAGSGTACILANDGNYMHCSGTGVGGGTILGLSKLLLGTADPTEIAELAKTGNESGVDLILEDVVSGPIGLLP